MVELNHGAYSGQNKCEYTGCWYNLKCNCRSHRRDREYYDKPNFINDITDEVFYKFVRSDSYEILQIEPPTTPEDLKKAYRKMSLKTHPDKGGSSDDFIKVKNAYEDILMVL